MTPRLSNEERQALDAQDGATPIEVIDDRTAQVYYLISVDQYEKMKSPVNTEDFDIRDTYAAQDQVARSAGWNDPQMNVYNDYDAHRKQP